MNRFLRRLKEELLPSRHAFDCVRGTDTSGTVALKRLRIASDNKSAGTSYQATSPEVFQQAMSSIPVDGYTFIDLGCGKGRILLLAAELGFRNIVGVEFSPHLARIARNNLAIMGVDAGVVTGDAAEFSFPDDPMVVFMYNPFGALVMRKVMAKLAVQRHPVFVVYANPKHESTFPASFIRIARSQHWAVWRKEAIAP
jgi:SAM-dependent methyltransferase